MTDTQQQRSALIFGARNLGRATVERLRADGWAVAAVARSDATLALASSAGALALRADVTDPASVRGALDEAAFLSTAARFALDQDRPATLIQVTGGSSRRAMPGRGLWAAGAFSVRAITQAAALELREHGVHVALLIVDAGIEPFEGGGREGVDPATLADPREIADAVAFLATQGARAATHELQVTPLAERWVP